MEMLRFGTTSFNDMYMYTGSIVKAVRDNGMRALIGHGVVDSDGSCKDLEEGVELAKNWNRTCNDRIRVSIAPHAEYTSTPQLIKAAARAALEFDIPFHIHVSETKAEHDGCINRRGLTPMQYLQSLGALDAKVLAAHCVWPKRRGYRDRRQAGRDDRAQSHKQPEARQRDRTCRPDAGARLHRGFGYR